MKRMELRREKDPKELPKDDRSSTNLTHCFCIHRQYACISAIIFMVVGCHLQQNVGETVRPGEGSVVVGFRKAEYIRIRTKASCVVGDEDVGQLNGGWVVLLASQAQLEGDTFKRRN